MKGLMIWILSVLMTGGGVYALIMGLNYLTLVMKPKEEKDGNTHQS